MPKESTPLEPDVILRVERTANYKTICLFACDRDTRISWKAVGLLTYLLSRPDGWKFFASELEKRHTDGKNSVSSGLIELEATGYLRREVIRGERGRFQTKKWHVSEKPLTPQGWDQLWFRNG